MGRNKKQNMETEIMENVGQDIPPYPFDDDIKEDLVLTDVENMTATELESRFTAKQLAIYACQYINAGTSTVEKWAKKDIIAVILNKGMNKESKPRVRNDDTKRYVRGFTDILNKIKIERDNKPLEILPRESFENAAINIIAEKEAKGELTYSGANKYILAIAGAALLFDTFYGFNNIGKLIQKIKDKRAEKKNAEPSNPTK
jgi:hypothetical protein